MAGTIRWAVNLDWQDLPLGAILARADGLPASVANDSRAAALAEYLFDGGAGRAPNLVAIKVGRGIGAGIVIGGELFNGDGFGAGEIGHTRSSTTAPSAAAAGSAVSRRSPARGARRRGDRGGRGDPDRSSRAARGAGSSPLADLARGARRRRRGRARVVAAAGRYLGQSSPG